MKRIITHSDKALMGSAFLFTIGWWSAHLATYWPDLLVVGGLALGTFAARWLR